MKKKEMELKEAAEAERIAVEKKKEEERIAAEVCVFSVSVLI